MPKSTESILIIIGIVLILFSFLNDNIKYKDFNFSEPSHKKKIFLFFLGVVLLLLGLASHFFSLNKDNSNVDSTNTKNNVIALTETNIRYIVKSAGYNELDDFPVTTEIFNAVRGGFKSYQSRICKSKNGGEIIVPLDFKRCPYDIFEASPKLGKILDLSAFKN